MAFNSINFLLFFMIVTIIYYILPSKTRWVLLLTASYFFYMCWNPIYSLLMLLSTLITFFTSSLMVDRSDKIKKILLVFSLISNLSILGLFKYYNFAVKIVEHILSIINISIQFNMPTFNFLLPVGISFYTFQALSYSIDVYRGDIKPIKKFGRYALFVSFFPQLVAGPIERSSHLIPQFDKKVEFNYERVKSGLLLMGWGILKKVIIADRVAILVNRVYNNAERYNGSQFVLASIFFAIQIYCDFSAYSDIARGSARVLGFDLMKNFNAPYIATSISDFWKRWHISLTSWFRDYLYIPLGGNRVSKKKWLYNILIVFLISGLWHGASIMFIIWGFLHGIYQIIEILTKNIRSKLAKKLYIDSSKKASKILSCFFTFILVDYAWIYFRANNIKDAIFINKKIFTSNVLQYYNLIFNKGMYKLGIDEINFKITVIFIAILLVVDVISQKKLVLVELNNQHLVVRWLVYFATLFSVIIFGVYGGNTISEFIYFQF